MTIKILNLYAGIGGNRKLWTRDITSPCLTMIPGRAVRYGLIFSSQIPATFPFPNSRLEYLNQHKVYILMIISNTMRYEDLKMRMIEEGALEREPTAEEIVEELELKE